MVAHTLKLWTLIFDGIASNTLPLGIAWQLLKPINRKVWPDEIQRLALTNASPTAKSDPTRLMTNLSALDLISSFNTLTSMRAVVMHLKLDKPLENDPVWGKMCDRGNRLTNWETLALSQAAPHLKDFEFIRVLPPEAQDMFSLLAKGGELIEYLLELHKQVRLLLAS